MAIASVNEVVFTFAGVEVLEEFADRLPQCADGACGGFAQQGFELGEDLFDGLRSGLYGGRQRRWAPTASIAVRMPAPCVSPDCR